MCTHLLQAGKPISVQFRGVSSKERAATFKQHHLRYAGDVSGSHKL